MASQDCWPEPSVEQETNIIIANMIRNNVEHVPFILHIQLCCWRCWWLVLSLACYFVCMSTLGYTHSHINMSINNNIYLHGARFFGGMVKWSTALHGCTSVLTETVVERRNTEWNDIASGWWIEWSAFRWVKAGCFYVWVEYWIGTSNLQRGSCSGQNVESEHAVYQLLISHLLTHCSFPVPST